MSLTVIMIKAESINGYELEVEVRKHQDIKSLSIMEDTDDNEHSLGQILESSLVLPSDSNSTFTKQPVNETSRQFLELLGPDSLKTNGEPVYKDYSAPTGSYGKHGEPQSEVNKSFAEPRSGIKLRELLGSEANELSSSHPPRYSREDIVALRDTPAIFQLWNLNYKELIASEFPQLFVGNVIDLANEEEEDNSNFFLRPYQEEIVKRSLAGENDIILLPTGTGKTLVAIKVIIQHIQNRLKNGQKVKVIFFVPRTDLATQQLKQIKKFIPSEWRAR
ncbi:hypothetical protein EB796_011576 [Bugula neritina]|uniref:Helicase ATP-binding domain-containing protein n=1 Tax=Bugula neritina TaxID=10212 RepID=A0A7J7JXP4_BUGNE|nr:hypothetical protein EB796_011576 [Bugula neritina]